MSEDPRRSLGQRLKKRYGVKPASDSTPGGRQMGAAYQGAFESVFAIVIGVLLGWWADSSLDSAPWGLAIGATIGFGAFVLRLSRLGTALDSPGEDAASPEGDRAAAPRPPDPGGAGKRPSSDDESPGGTAGKSGEK